VLRLFPGPAVRLAAREVYQDISFPIREERPWVVINMVTSLDGKASVGGKASPIGSPLDRILMRGLRARADAVLIGAGTLRAEKLRLDVPEEFARQRVARGLKPQPLAVVATSNGDLPIETNLLAASPESLLVMVSSEIPHWRIDALSSGAVVEEIAPRNQGGHPDMGKALELLKERYQADVLVVEGGPVLNHALVSAGLVDELFLTLAPKILGGDRSDTSTVLEGPVLPALDKAEAALISAYLSQGSELFLRYALDL